MTQDGRSKEGDRRPKMGDVRLKTGDRRQGSNPPPSSVPGPKKASSVLRLPSSVQKPYSVKKSVLRPRSSVKYLILAVYKEK